MSKYRRAAKIDANQPEIVRETKECSMCGQELPVNDFYKNSNKYRSACKDCTNKRARKLYPNYREKRNKNMRNHYKENKKQYQLSHAVYRRSDRGKEILTQSKLRFLLTEKGRESVKKSHNLYVLKNRVKRQAHWRVKSALLRGKLKREPCGECGRTNNIQAHHEDYSKPLNVRWLCRDHHQFLHRSVLNAKT